MKQPESVFHKKASLEILVSTMNRVDLLFLEKMFKNVNLNDFHVLVVNQLDLKAKPLVSNRENVRVINSFKKGLSNSRNLAIENAMGDLCLFADDDVTYLDGFKDIILHGFNKYKEADVVTFQMINDKEELFRKYKDQAEHDRKTIVLANSVVIAFNRTRLLQSNARFDSLFGLGCVFPTGDEYVFLMNCLSFNLKLYFYPKVILMHPEFSSGQAAGTDKVLFARAALFYKYHNGVGYLKLVHQLFLLLKYKKIRISEIWHKFSVGLKGIKAYKKYQESAT